MLLAEGKLQDRHEELDVELLEACTAHDADRAGRALHDHLELASDIYTVELKGCSIFAFRRAPQAKHEPEQKQTTWPFGLMHPLREPRSARRPR